MEEMGVSSFTNKPYGALKKQYAKLDNYLQDVKDKQGAIGNLWNGVKNLTGIGTNEKKCDSMLEKYKNGEIDFEQALDYIEEFDRKQEDTTNLITNVATGTASIAATIALGLGGVPLLAVGGVIGAVAKTGLKLFDRATNNIKNDEFDAKTMAKDAVTGAITGMASSVQTSMFGKTSNSIKSFIGNSKINISQEALNSTLVSRGIDGFASGLVCGALSGSANYMTDVAFGDRDFKVKDLAGSTIATAAVAAPVGGIVTAGASSISSSLSQTAKDCVASSAKKFLSYEVNQAKHAVA